MSRPYQKTELTVFQKILNEVMDKVYEEKEFPRKADYEKAVINKYNEEYSCHFEYRGAFHSQIWDAISYFIRYEKMTQIGKYVIPLTDKSNKTKAKYAIKRYLSYKQDSIHRISDNTIAIALSDDTDIDYACEMFKEFLGKNHCYSIINIGTTVIIMLHNYEHKEDEKENTDNEAVENKDINENKDSKDIADENANVQNTKNTNAMEMDIVELNTIIKEKYHEDIEKRNKRNPFKEARAKERAARKAAKKSVEAAKLQESKETEQVHMVNENNNKD